MSIQLA